MNKNHKTCPKHSPKFLKHAQAIPNKFYKIPRKFPINDLSRLLNLGAALKHLFLGEYRKILRKYKKILGRYRKI